MPARRVIVLKFGGSVLACPESLSLAVHEIYRWRRDGWSVLAVVSAFNGETDALLGEAIERGNGACRHVLAAAVGQGELRSASQLGLLLERSGVPASVVNPGAIGLRATGDPLDADPCAVDTAGLLNLFDEDRVVVCPGFVATDDSGRWLLLGRGGSDLTALFLTAELRNSAGVEARCRLIKDVDGLYDSDPKAGPVLPERYAAASWDDALARDGSIIQHKAIAFAKSRGLAFEMGCLGGTRPTRIGSGPLAVTPPEPSPPVRTALLGLGVVGTGVYEHLSRLPEVRFCAIAVRSLNRQRDASVPRELLTTDPINATTSGADLVIETMGGTDEAYRAVKAALESGSHVVTANKALIAERGEELRTLAGANGVTIRCSASVGGSVPIIERIRARPNDTVARIRGVLNGTCNFILDRLARGEGLAESIAEAQRLGYAEQDPTRDLVGFDAADKLRVLSATAGLPNLREQDISRSPIDASTPALVENAARAGRVVRQVATLDLTGATPRARVSLETLVPDDPLFGVSGDRNAAVIEWRSAEREFVSGRGAGRYPTAESVVADVFELMRERSASHEEVAA